MLIVVQIDLSDADVVLFNEYEEKAIALLPRHGGKLKERLRSVDGRSELHLLDFPNAPALDAFKSDPDRIALQDMWQRCRATSVLKEMIRVT